MRLLVEAMPAVLARVPSAIALIAGDGPEEAMLKRFVADLGIGVAVRFLGHVPHSEIASYYRTADVFALTSVFDNSPNVVLEAMASGLPVVCTDVGGVGEFVETAGGDLVAVSDPDQLASRLVFWLQSRSRRDLAGKHNRLVVQERYSWRASAVRLLAVYQRAIERRHGQRRQVPA
jgi:phosphatidylinositol alpha-1,6-mannosyltransferase